MKLKYLGVREPPAGFEVEQSRIGVAGVGLVGYGEVFDVSKERADELLAKEDHVFVAVDEGLPDQPKSGRKGK